MTGSSCPRCGAPWQKAVGLGLDGRSPGSRYQCGSLYINPSSPVVETSICRYAAGLKEKWLKANDTLEQIRKQQ